MLMGALVAAAEMREVCLSFLFQTMIFLADWECELAIIFSFEVEVLNTSL